MARSVEWTARLAGHVAYSLYLEGAEVPKERPASDKAHDRYWIMLGFHSFGGESPHCELTGLTKMTWCCYEVGRDMLTPCHGRLGLMVLMGCDLCEPCSQACWVEVSTWFWRGSVLPWYL